MSLNRMLNLSLWGTLYVKTPQKWDEVKKVRFPLLLPKHRSVEVRLHSLIL